MKNLNKFSDLIGCSNSFFEKWIIHRLCGEIILENFGSVWCTDHSSPLRKTNLSIYYELYKSTNWLNLRLVYCNENK